MNWTIHDEPERRSVIEYISKLRLEKPWHVEVKRKTKRRTLPQNRLMWAYLSALSKWTGNDRDDLHVYFADRYLPKKCVEVFGKQVEHRGSTTDLDTAAFSEYIERIRRDAEELGYPMPSPSSPLYEQFIAEFDGKVA